jgi:hypothetical protein
MGMNSYYEEHGTRTSGSLRPHNLGAAAADQENNMLKEFVEKITSLAEPQYKETDDGRLYVDKQLRELMSPQITPILVQTLGGFRDLYKLRDSSAAPCFIQIQDHTQVWAIQKELDEWNRRPHHIHAAVPTDTPRFPFGQWMDPEDFIIKMMTLFEDAEFGSDHRKIVKLVSGLAAEAVTISNDDGISQQVITKQGMVTKNEEKVSPRVSLAPFRTFRDIAQPTSDFIMRLRSRQGQMPSCALFEADGGEWKHAAMKTIAEYFAKELPDANIVA